jgi:hypothetical protein
MLSSLFTSPSSHLPLHISFFLVSTNMKAQTVSVSETYNTNTKARNPPDKGEKSFRQRRGVHPAQSRSPSGKVKKSFRQRRGVHPAQSRSHSGSPSGKVEKSTRQKAESRSAKTRSHIRKGEVSAKRRDQIKSAKQVLHASPPLYILLFISLC